MTAQKDAAPRRAERSLRTRMLLVVVVALLPAAFVSVVQGLDRIQRDAEEVRALLVQTARATAGDEQNLLAAAEQILRAHANQTEVREADARCRLTLENALRGLSFFPNLTRVDKDGSVACSALPNEPLNFRDSAWWGIARETPGFFITEPAFSPLTNSIVMRGVLPLRNSDGSFDGTLNISLEVQWLDFMLQTQQLPEGAVAALFNRTGALITASDQDQAAEIFGGGVRPELSNQLLSGVGRDGEEWSYAVAPVLGSTTYIGFAMPNAVLFRSTYVHVATDLLLPALMLGLASIAIWIATDRLVLRWIDHLRRVAVAYSRGHYAFRPNILDTAPSEFRTFGGTLAGMAAAVQERDRALRDSIEQKNTMNREIHHRVKNNLQIVMSLLSLQTAQLQDESAREALRDTQMRVNALALVHRILHELEDVYFVDFRELLSNLVNQVREGFGATKNDLTLELEIVERQMTSDIAVPLTLFAVEALTNVFKHAYPPGAGGGTIRVSLTAAPNGNLQLVIEDDGAGIKSEVQKENVGSRLMRAFASQLRGSVTTHAANGGGTRVELTFPDPARARAEGIATDATSRTDTAAPT
jgi:two-component sensor histidine kinase